MLPTALFLVLALAAPAAEVAGEAIPLSAVDARITDELAAAQRTHDSQVYDLRKEALRALIDERLVEAEAKRRGQTPQELMKAEVEQQVKPPDEATVKAFFEARKHQMDGATFEQVGPSIVEFLSGQALQGRYQAFVGELRDKAKVRIHLEPIRVAVEAIGAGAWGPANAPVTIVAFEDYECPYCSRAAQTIREVLGRYPHKVRFVYRDFPLPFHERAVPAAVAARCAGAQGRYKEMYDALYGGAEIDDAGLAAAAKSVGLDLAKFATCQADPALARAVAVDHEAGKKLGVTGTPAFFVNGVAIHGAQPPEAFIELIDAELARRGKR